MSIATLILAGTLAAILVEVIFHRKVDARDCNKSLRAEVARKEAEELARLDAGK